MAVALRQAHAASTVVPRAQANHAHASGHAHAGGESEDWEYSGQLTSRISAKESGGGREIYVYLNPGDCLDSEDIAAATSHVNVWVDSDGHRHWTVQLAPVDVLETGRPEPPPPPPPPTGGG